MPALRPAVGHRVKLEGDAAPFGVVTFVRIHELIVAISGGPDVAVPAAALISAAEGVITVRGDRLPAAVSDAIRAAPR